MACKEYFKSLLSDTARYSKTKYGEKCELPLGAFVGKVTLESINETLAFKDGGYKKGHTTVLKAQGMERYEWHFSNAVQFETPIAATGKFWLWEYEPPAQVNSYIINPTLGR